MRSCSACRSGKLANASLIGRFVAAVTVSTNAPSRGDNVPITSAADRPSGVSDTCRNAVRRSKACAGRSMQRRISPGASALVLDPVTKSTIEIRRSPPSRDQMVPTPSSALASEIIGPAGSAMQMLPPTVAVFQILNDATNARQH